MKKRERILLNKADDITRRQFIHRASMLLGAFGIPWLTRMETMEKISKKVFGNSLAFAQGTDFTPLITFGMRAGYPIESTFCMAQDANAAETATNRNIHFGPDTTITVDNSASGGRNLYLAPQMATFAVSPYAARTAMLTSVMNNNGHTNEPGSIWKDDSGHFFNHVAYKNAQSSYAPLLSQGVVFGQSNTVSFDRLGALTGDFFPVYADSSDEIRSLFQPFQLKDANNANFTEPLSEKIFDTLNSEFNETFLKLIESRPGGQAIVASAAKQKELLTLNLAAELTPSTELIDAIATGVTAPNMMRLNTALGSDAQALAEFFVMTGLMMAKQVTYSVGLACNTGDWHGNNTLFTAADPGDGTAQGQHAACWNTLLTNVMNEYTSNPAYMLPDGMQLGDKLRMVWYSEFTRTYAINGGDNGDGGKTGCLLMGPAGSLKAGTYGNVTATAGQGIACDPTTGNDSSTPGQLLENTYMFNTIARFLGLDLGEIGVASANHGKVVTAMLG